MALVDERIQEFLTDAREINSQAEVLLMLVNLHDNDPAYDKLDARIEDVCEMHIDWVYRTYNGTTPHNYITRYRNALQRAKFSRYFLECMKERDDEVEQRLQNHNAGILKRQENQYPLTPEQVTAFIETATTLLQSDYYADVVIGLCVLTGRRPYEVAVTGRFRRHRHAVFHANQYVYYRGFAKTRNEARARRVVEMPMLIDPMVICNAHRRLRTLNDLSRFHPHHFPTEDGADTAFMRYCGARFREQNNKYFRPIVPDLKEYLPYQLSPQKLRKIYNALVVAWWDHTGWSDQRFIMEILGHYDLRNAESYLDFCLSTQVPRRFLAHNVILKGMKHGA